MRTLKFRAYDSATGKVSEPFDVKERWGDYLIDFEDYSTDGALDSIIWEQFTGLLDRNGKEIFENDIVAPNGEWEEIEGTDCSIISFENGCFRVGDGCENEAGSYLSDWRVIGNVHQNDDLLEGK